MKRRWWQLPLLSAERVKRERAALIRDVDKSREAERLRAVVERQGDVLREQGEAFAAERRRNGFDQLFRKAVGG